MFFNKLKEHEINIERHLLINCASCVHSRTMCSKNCSAMFTYSHYENLICKFCNETMNLFAHLELTKKLNKKCTRKALNTFFFSP